MTECKGESGVTQGNPLSPTIFNMVVDGVVRHWLHLATQEAERGGNGGGSADTRRPFLRGRRDDSVDRPPLAPVGFHDPSGPF